MATEDKSTFSSLSPQDQRGTDPLQNNQMKDTIKQLRDRGYQVTEEYGNTGLSKVSGETPPRKTWWDLLQVFIQLLTALALPIALFLASQWITTQQSEASGKASEQQQEEVILQNYLNDMQDLLTHYNLGSPFSPRTIQFRN